MASVQDLVKQILLAAHPVGSYYWSSESTDPGTLFGGTWERVKGRFVYASDADTAGETGGASTHAITVAEMPSHTHTRGTMEIRGSLSYIASEVADVKSDGSNFSNYPTSGALAYINYKFSHGAKLDVPATGGRGAGRDIVFTGSKGWTGATSSTGGGSAMSIMPPYITAFCWRRTA